MALLRTLLAIACAIALPVEAGGAEIPPLACPLATCTTTQGFGANWSFGRCPQVVNGQPGPYKVHTAVDLRASAGATVKSALAGGIVKSVYSAGSGWGQAVEVEHSDANGSKFVLQYMHLNPRIGLNVGSAVAAGESIGTIAAISAPHLHFGVWNGAFSGAGQEIFRGALPRCTAGTCFDGMRSDKCFPARWVDPLAFIRSHSPTPTRTRTATPTATATVSRSSCPMSATLSSVVPQRISGSTSVLSNNMRSASCGGGGLNAPDAVYMWTAPRAGSFTISTVGSAFDTLLSVRSGGCLGAELGCNDDFAGRTSQVTVWLTAGQKVAIVVDGYGSASGPYSLSIR